MCLTRKITTLITKRLKMPQKATLFSDIRKAPQIPLSAIILSISLMPFLHVKSMLMLDCLNRFQSIKRLFAPSLWNRKMVCSDSTIQRIARWVKPEEAQQFLLSLLPVFRRRNLLLHPLLPEARARRIGIMDGSCMGNHWVLACTLVGADTLRYPVVIEDLPGRGHELSCANDLIPRLHSLLGSATPQLLLYDALAFTAPFFHTVRENNMHLLIKSSHPDFRDVLKDAQELFVHGDTSMFTTCTGFDTQRLCAWKIEMTSDSFAGYPVHIGHLIEKYDKRTPRPPQEAWIVTTDCSLSPQEIREAAHLRWSIENDCFKKLSTLAGTKRFHFKDQKPFLTMLRLFCLSITAFELCLFMVHQSKKDYQLFRDGMKETTATRFLRFFSFLENGVFSC